MYFNLHILFDGIAMQLSDDARKLLKYFQDNVLAHGEYEYSARMLRVFNGDAGVCEKAQRQLSELGLLDLGSAPSHSSDHHIRSAALSLAGDRYLEKNSFSN